MNKSGVIKTLNQDYNVFGRKDVWYHFSNLISPIKDYLTQSFLEYYSGLMIDWRSNIMKFPTHIVAVGGLISNKEGKILLVKSPRRGWEFPGGQVEVGEDLMTALKREVEEESGIIVDVKQLVGVYSNIKTEVREDTGVFIPTKVMFDFLGEMVSGELRTSEESLEVGWFEREMVLDMITQPFLKDRARDMLEFDGKVIYRAYSKSPYEIHVERTM